MFASKELRWLAGARRRPGRLDPPFEWEDWEIWPKIRGRSGELRGRSGYSASTLADDRFELGCEVANARKVAGCDGFGLDQGAADSKAAAPAFRNFSAVVKSTPPVGMSRICGSGP